MRKYVSVLLTLCLLLALCVPALAEVNVHEDSAATSGIDVVIVLDMTNSMKVNDKSNYRLDAAAMLVSMLDMNSSRVAVIPYARQPIEEKIIPLTAVADKNTRDMLIQKIYDMGELQAHTNYGTALMYANQMLLERGETSNQAMILFVTDGRNDLSGATDPVTHSLRWRNGQIEDDGSVMYDDQLANTVTREAVDCASESGFPIYVIAMTTDPSRAPAGSLSLEQISENTGVRNGCHRVEKASVAQLPEFFAKVLADKIGSSVQLSAKVRPTQEEDTYEVEIPVLNESVMEVNVILPVRLPDVVATASLGQGIDGSSIQIYDANGNRVSGGDKMISNSSKAHFAMVKISKPSPQGIWRLTFKSNTDPSNIAFNILYNYKIRLKGQADASLYKTDRLAVQAWFEDETGNRATDRNLYQTRATNPKLLEDWMVIRGTWALQDTQNRTVASGELETKEEEKQFASEIDLGALKLPSGQYTLSVRAAGAGLERMVEMPVELKNRAPSGQNMTCTIDVNATESGKEATWTVAGTSGTLEKTAQELVKDADGDKLVFTLEAVGNARDIIDLPSKPDEEGKIAYSTVMQTNGQLASGTAVYKLNYTDNDKNGSGSVTLTFQVISGIDTMRKTYEPEVTVRGTESNGEYKKNTDITIAVKLKEKETGNYAEIRELNKTPITLTVYDKQGNQIAPFDVEAKDNGNAKEMTGNTGNQADEWKVEVQVGPFDPVQLTVSIPNKSAPVPAAQKTTTIRCNGGGVPGFLTVLLGNETAEDDAARQVNPQKDRLFTDTDGDVLTYGKPVLTDANGNALDESKITLTLTEENDGHYRIDAHSTGMGLFHYSFTARLKMDATDGDGQTGTYVETIVVEDLHSKMLTYALMALAALVALVMLVLVIRQICKPVFPGMKVELYTDAGIYPEREEALAPVKRMLNANQFVEQDVAGEHQISLSQLQNILIKPIRSRKAVGVVCKKLESGHVISIDDKNLKQGKLYPWNVESELMISRTSSEGGIRLKLTENAQEVAESEEDADEWISNDEAGDFSGKPQVSKRSTWQKKAPTTEKKPDDDGFAF